MNEGQTRLGTEWGVNARGKGEVILRIKPLSLKRMAAQSSNEHWKMTQLAEGQSNGGGTKGSLIDSRATNHSNKNLLLKPSVLSIPQIRLPPLEKKRMSSFG